MRLRRALPVLVTALVLLCAGVGADARHGVGVREGGTADAATATAPLAKRQLAESCTAENGAVKCGFGCGPCRSGCCRRSDLTCGTGPDFCSDSCLSSLSAKGACDEGFVAVRRTQPPGANASRTAAHDEDEAESSLQSRKAALEPNAMAPIGASCSVTPGRPWGGCASSCCLNGRCTFCDRCQTTNPARCRACINGRFPLSPEGCLRIGDRCQLGNATAGTCRSGCCKNRQCQWCEECRGCTSCTSRGLNPAGRCVTRTRTRTRTTTRPPLPFPPGSGRGSGVLITQCRDANRVALTFDDGPYIYTSDLLDILRARGVKATFFLNGDEKNNVYARADLIRRMVADGHCVGNHGWKHIDMPAHSYDEQYRNIERVSDALRDIIGSRPRFFRPPYGYWNAQTQEIAARLGHDLARWNLDTYDWEQRGVDGQMNVYYAAMANADPWRTNFIALMHDIFPSTAYDLAPRAIDYVRSRGYQLVDMGTCTAGWPGGCYQ
ncbi:hypothetical protein DFJ74DRAFT_448753 [Hyaloraphidium curvatum]|nr:hypothetical protein DFJ74DRAFT_448753 [Hyaloraphidium curvatum]